MGTHIRKYLSIFLIGLVFAIAGCSSDSSSGISDEDRLPDTDNDGIVDKNDPDIDGDGILNKDDTDTDGDGTPDAIDPEPNGDGGEAPTPGLTCTSAKIKPPKTGRTGRLNTASWELLPEGCGVTVNRTVVVTATYEGVTTESDNASLGEETTNITLPQNCRWEEGTEVPITYDFQEIADALGDTSGDLKQIVDATVRHASSKCKNPVINVSNLRNRRFYTELKSTVNTDGTVTGVVPRNANAGLYTPGASIISKRISALSEPKWSATPKGFMNIYTTGDECSLKSVDIDSRESSGNYITKPENGSWKHYKTWESLQAADEVKGCEVDKRPSGMGFLGNFVVTWHHKTPPLAGSEFTIISYNPQ